MLDEQIAILQHRLTSKKVFSLASNLLDHILNDIDQQLANPNQHIDLIASKNTLTSDLTRLEQLKRNII